MSGARSRLGVVVPAGGTSSRFGSGDKLAADVGGTSLLDRTLGALPEHAVVVCVGPPAPTTREVRWVREEPALAGPLAAVAAGVRALPPGVTLVGLVGADMPAAGRLLPSLCLALAVADPPAAASVAVDPAGHRQPLLSVWALEALERRLGVLGDRDGLAGRPLRSVLDDVVVVDLPVPGTATADVDTPEDLEHVRHPRGPAAGPTAS